MSRKISQAIRDDLLSEIEEEEALHSARNKKIRIVRSKKAKETKTKHKLEAGEINLEDLGRQELLELLDVLNASVDDVDPIEESRLRLYKPNHEVALRLHLCESLIQLVGGGNRSGKTTTAIIDKMIGLTGIVPKALVGIYPETKLRVPQFGRIVSTDFPNGIDKVILPMFIGPRAWFPQSMIAGWDSKNRTLLIRHITGVICSVEFMSYDQDVEKFQGTSRHWILYDEEPPQTIRKECLMRTMDVNGHEIFSMTPTKGMSWTFDEIFEKRGREVSYDESRKLEKGDRDSATILKGRPDTDILVPDGDEDIHFFNFFSMHNPNINQERVAKESKKMSESERAMRMFGQYISFTGKIFCEYSEETHLVKEVFDIPADWPRYYALDPHPRTPHAVLFLAVDSMGRKWVYDELWTHESCTTKDLAEKMYEKLYYQVKDNEKQFGPFVPGQSVKLVNKNGLWQLEEPIKFKMPFIARRYIDPSAEIPSPSTGTTLMNDLINMGLGYFFLGSKDLQRGILRVKDALKAEEVFFFPHLTRTRYEFRRYVWDDFQQSVDKRNPKQKPRDKDDHMMENLRRLLVEEPIYINKEEYTSDIEGWRRY